MNAATRTASLRRATSESTVELELDLDGTGAQPRLELGR